MATAGVNKLTAENFAARLGQANWVIISVLKVNWKALIKRLTQTKQNI